MSKTVLMHPSKVTDNKLRWNFRVKGVDFKINIFKWRVPRPWPTCIIVHVNEIAAGQKSQNKISTESDSLERGMIAFVEKFEEHTKTVRYRPRGNSNDWEIGEPYIPKSLLSEKFPNVLQIQVLWDRSEGTWSD